MRTVPAALPRTIASLAVAALVVAGLVAGPQAPAVADAAPADPATPATVAGDSLPTVQVDGVVWSQVIVGTTVYVAGQFTTARPAGAAAGTATVARSNLLAYDLGTGNLITSWAPTLNGPAYVISASADGTRLYVGGDFTLVNGSGQNRFAVLNRSTGARISGFAGANAAVRAIASTTSTIYIGGNFNTVAGTTRYRLAAMSATTGALLTWKVSAQSQQVETIVLSPDKSRLIVGGRFTSLGGIAALGSGAVSASTAAVLPWAANKVIQDWGYGAGIMSLTTDGTLVYGSGFAFIRDSSSAGNLEGVFAANPKTGEIVWVEDCHGDTYSVFANPGGDSIYSVGHVHYCQNIGAYPESPYRYALAWSKTTNSTITPNAAGTYYNWQGFRAPDQLNFYPDFTRGSFTGQNQAAWEVTGTADYVLFGGEFLTINGSGQQGLGRMAVSTKSTNLQGPRLSGLQPVATSKAAGTAQVSWPTNWDPDNETLSYSVLRDNDPTPVYTTTADSRWYRTSRVSFTDTGLVSGRNYSYKIVASDPFGNSVTSPSVTVNVAGSSAGTLGTYARGVLNDDPVGYWRLGENSGSAQDWTGYANASVGNQVNRPVAGAISGDTNGAARFTGSSSSRVYTTTSTTGTNRFSLEAWFKTTSTSGGKIIGFGSSSNSNNSGNYDRHVYMGTDGRLTFGVNPNALRVITTPAAYNDGQWHHLVATLGRTGMRLYVDGTVRASDPDTVSAQVFNGYWHIGGDAVSGWPGAGSDNFAGDIDDVAVYGRALTASEVTLHHGTGISGTIPNLPPTASFTATGGELTASFNASASSDSDGSITSYAWNFGDGAAGTGVTATHPYAVGGTKTVTLTVTDLAGATGTVSHDVVVANPNSPPVASFTVTPTTGRTVAVDASATTDPDGTVSSYAWTFGDGGTATGKTASHTYASDGTYTVQLIATDDVGASGSTSRSITVLNTVVASDAFGRTVADGFGSADLGGAWTATAGATSVTGSVGQLTLQAAGSVAGARLAGVTGTALRTQVTESWDKRPNGSGGWFLLRGRITTNGEYRLKVGHKSSGAVTAQLVRTTAAGAETALTTETTVAGLTYAAGTPIAALFEVSGTSPTTLRAKVLAAGGAEPAAWLIDTTDATAGLQGAGHTGLAALLSSSATNGPVAVRVDDYIVNSVG